MRLSLPKVQSGTSRVRTRNRGLAAKSGSAAVEVVSTRGVLLDLKLMSRELRQERLEQEGLTIVPCGVKNRSLMVKNYNLYLFDFNAVSGE